MAECAVNSTGLTIENYFRPVLPDPYGSNSIR